MGSVTNFSTSSALRPGHWAMIFALVLVTSGKASIGVCLKETIPAITASTVKKNMKNLFFKEKAMMLSMNLCFVTSLLFRYTSAVGSL